MKHNRSPVLQENEKLLWVVRWTEIATKQWLTNSQSYYSWQVCKQCGQQCWWPLPIKQPCQDRLDVWNQARLKNKTLSQLGEDSTQSISNLKYYQKPKTVFPWDWLAHTVFVECWSTPTSIHPPMQSNMLKHWSENMQHIVDRSDPNISWQIFLMIGVTTMSLHEKMAKVSPFHWLCIKWLFVSQRNKAKAQIKRGYSALPHFD